MEFTKETIEKIGGRIISQKDENNFVFTIDNEKVFELKEDVLTEVENLTADGFFGPNYSIIFDYKNKKAEVWFKNGEKFEMPSEKPTGVHEVNDDLLVTFVNDYVIVSDEKMTAQRKKLPEGQRFYVEMPDMFEMMFCDEKPETVLYQNRFSTIVTEGALGAISIETGELVIPFKYQKLHWKKDHVLCFITTEGEPEKFFYKDL